MKEEEFNTYFWKIADKYLVKSLSLWQLKAVAVMAKKCIKKGRCLERGGTLHNVDGKLQCVINNNLE